MHAPGYAQALTAAVLRDQAVHHADAKQWDIALDSARIRTAVALAEQVRAGVHISEALGREIERRVGEPGKVLALRRTFPARPEWSGRRVCDGQQVLDAAVLPAGIDGTSFDELRLALDTYADLLVSDALHDVVAGRAPAAAEALEASAGLGAPPELRLLRTQRGGGTVRTSVVVALPWSAAWDDPAAIDGAAPVAVADPALAGLLARELPAAAAWTWTAGASAVSLADLGLAVPDVPMFGPDALSGLAAAALAAPPDGGSAAAGHLARCAAICGALGAGTVPAEAAPTLRARLARLRSLAADLAAALALPDADPAVARPWGIAEGDAAMAAEALSARLASIGDTAGDATADAATLAERIRRLLPSALALPLACPASRSVQGGALDDGWLEVVAAVRPSLARLEVAQLTAPEPWPASLSDALPVWAPGDAASAHRTLTVTFRPAAPDDATPDIEAPVAIDGWAETIPSRLHPTWAAFGYDAPRARPQQAILLAVPADVDAPNRPADIRDSVLAARRLARIRGLRQPLAREVGLALPTSMIIDDAVTRAGATLTGDG